VSAIIRKAAYNVLLLAASTAVALLCSEIFLRWFFPVHPPRLISASGDESWIVRNSDGQAIDLIPHFRGRLVSSEFDIAVQLNEHGFRDQAFAAKKAPSATRICVLGDSFTFGYGVEANAAYSRQLAQILQGRGYDVEVYNLGIPGTATVFQYQLMQKFLYLRPDIVILGILATYADKAGNDLIDNLQFVEGHTVPSQLAPASMNNEWPRAEDAPKNRRFAKLVFYRLRSTRRWLLQHSHFYRRIELLIGQEHPSWLGRWQAESSRVRVEQGWMITQEWLLRFQALAQKHNFALVLLHIPFPDFRSDENAQMSRLLKDFAAAHKIGFVDQLLLAMRNNLLQPRDLYFLLDGHWRSRAHRLCAEVLADFLIVHHLSSTPLHD
jgi:hypothetical protein